MNKETQYCTVCAHREAKASWHPLVKKKKNTVIILFPFYGMYF